MGEGGGGDNFFIVEGNRLQNSISLDSHTFRGRFEQFFLGLTNFKVLRNIILYQPWLSHLLF